MNIYYLPGAAPFWQLPLRQRVFKASRILFGIALALPVVPIGIFMFVTGLHTRSFKMSVYDLPGETPFCQLSLRRRVFRVCRIVFGVTLVLPLVSICISIFVMALHTHSFSEAITLICFGLMLGYFSIAGTLILVWRPIRSKFDNVPPSPPAPSSDAAPSLIPIRPNTPLVAATTERYGTSD